MEGSTFKLRPFKHGDENRLVELLSDKDIYYNTSRIPYPYEKRDADEWVRYAMDQHAKGGNERIFAIALDEPVSDKVIGCISVVRMDRETELGFWLGKEYWGQGIASEAIGLIVNYAYESLDAQTVYAHVFATNKPSARALDKNGFALEETLERYVNKAGQEKDVLVYRKRKA